MATQSVSPPPLLPATTSSPSMVSMMVSGSSPAMGSAPLESMRKGKCAGYFRSSSGGGGMGGGGAGKWHHQTTAGEKNQICGSTSVLTTTTKTRSTTAETDSTTSSSSVPSAPRRNEGKDALCRAMGTLFLQHRVDKLQKECDSLQLEGQAKRKMHSWKGGSSNCTSKSSGWRSRCPVARQAAATFQKREAGTQGWQQHPHFSSSPSHHGEMAERTMSQERICKVVVADVSLLIYSLRTVYNWLKEDTYRVIVPAEALRTLDVLKKGNHCLNLAARKATRFLDERLQLRTESVEANASSLSLKPGLYAQKCSEKVTCAEWAVLESALHDEIHDGSVHVASSLSQEEVMQLTHSTRETLACSLYFLREYILHPTEKDTSPPVSVHLALALPPPHFDCSNEPLDGEGLLHNQDIKYGQRADGSLLLQTAKRLGMGDVGSSLGNMIIVAPTAASWLSANASIDRPG